MQVRVRFEHNTKMTVFMGKGTFQKFTRSTIWGVQLKSGDNLINEFDVSRFQIERTTKSMFIRLIYFFKHSQISGIFVIKGRELPIRNRSLYRRQ
jgi:hypothetical protein